MFGLESGELVLAPTAAADDFGFYRSAAEIASTSISTIGKLLDDFLSLAKIEDGRMTFEPFAVSLDGWLREATTSFTNALRAKSIQLQLSQAADIPASAFTDGTRLRQVLSNYISNAIKFSPQGGVIDIHLRRVVRAPTVVARENPPMSPRVDVLDIDRDIAEVKPRRGSRYMYPSRRKGHIGDPRDGPGFAAYAAPNLGGPSNRTDTIGEPSDLSPFLNISVTDGGPGIPAHEIALLFQPYAQLHAGVEQKGLGTGLGLAICKGIVELMGGAVGVTSQPGAGATFWFEFPLVDGPHRGHTKPPPPGTSAPHLFDKASWDQ